MKRKKLLAAAAAAVMLSSQGLAASADQGWDDYGYDDYGYNDDYGYYDDYGYGYDDTDQGYTEGYTWEAGNGENGGETTDSTDSDLSSDDSDTSRPDAANNAAVSIVLEKSSIVDKTFTVDMKISALGKIKGADVSVLYKSEVLELKSSKINKKAGGKASSAGTEPGVVQFLYTNEEGSDWKDSYVTMTFDVIDPSVKSTVIYMNVNSLLDENGTEITPRADGLIVDISSEVAYDIKDDESMYTELRVVKSSSPISYESLGLTGVSSVTLDSDTFAQASESSLTTTGTGLTNMTASFEDGTVRYYRLVVVESPAPAVTTDTGTAAPAGDTAAQASDASVSSPSAQVRTSELPGSGVVKTETRRPSKTKYVLIYVLVIAALAAIVIEYFVFFGNPYKKAYAAVKNRGSENDEEDYPEDGGGTGPYDDSADDGEDYDDTEEYDEFEDEENSDEDFDEEYDDEEDYDYIDEELEDDEEYEEYEDEYEDLTEYADPDELIVNEDGSFIVNYMYDEDEDLDDLDDDDYDDYDDYEEIEEEFDFEDNDDDDDDETFEI